MLNTLVALSCAAADFAATGNSDPDHRAAPNKQGEVVVTFDTMPTSITFDLPGHIKALTENNIPYTNGATETYVPSEGFHEGASYESWNDKDNKYSRMWIESQNDARIVVRHRCALIKGNTIVHQDKKKVAPYGPGNWADEWYTFHPDGTYTRRVKIWNAVARQSGGHGAKYRYELEGMYLWPGHAPGKMVADHLEKNGITLIKMDGTSKTVSFDPYPLSMNSSGHDMFKAYGKFVNANIHVINTKSKYRPYRIGRPPEKSGPFGGSNLMMSPYKPVHKMSQLVPSFPAGSNRESGYSVAGLGQMNYSDFWRLTDTSMSEIWLNGFTQSPAPAEELARLARSWQQAPKMSVRGGAGKAYGYDVGQRAYLIDANASGKAITLRLDASEDSPVVNPMFLINNWAMGSATLLIDGKSVGQGQRFRLGHYPSLDLEDGRQWKNVAAVWAETTATTRIEITIRPGTGKTGQPTAATNDGFRDWTDKRGRSIRAKLIKATPSNVLLEQSTGKQVAVRRDRLSPQDELYLKTLKD
jgi:hypothetical protein